MTFLKKIRKAGRKEILMGTIIPSKPRQATAGYDMAKALRRIMQMHPEMPLEELADRVCRSPAWIQMHLKMYDDLQNRLRTMSSLELYRWLKTPPMTWQELLPNSPKSSDESHTTVGSPAVPTPAALTSEQPAI